MSIQLHQLNVWHGKKHLLNHVDLTLAKGHCLVIIGESGAGKTMLLRALMGQLPSRTTFSGELLYDGKAQILTGSSLQISKMTYMAQNPMSMFNPFQKIDSHFIEMVQSHHHLPKQEVLQLAERHINNVNLDKSVLQAYPFELSGGQLQRIMFAMGLCVDVQTYILDEPTSALDDQTSQFIVQMIKQLRALEKTIVLTTHDYKFAQQVGERMVVMKKGEKIAEGTLEDILCSNDAYIRILVKNPYQRLVDSKGEMLC